MRVEIIIQLFFQDHFSCFRIVEYKTEDRQIDDHAPYLILGLVHPVGQLTHGEIIGIIPVCKLFQEIERVLGIHVLDLVVGLVVEKVGGPETGFPDGRSPQTGEERLVLICLPDETVGRNVQLVVGVVIRTGGHEVIRLVKGYFMVGGVVVEGDVGMVDRVLVHEKGDGRLPAGDVILMYSKEDGPDQETECIADGKAHGSQLQRIAGTIDHSSLHGKTSFIVNARVQVLDPEPLDIGVETGVCRPCRDRDMTDLVFKPAFDRFTQVSLVDEHHTVEQVPVAGEIDPVITQEHIHGIGRVTGSLPGDFSFLSIPYS